MRERGKRWKYCEIFSKVFQTRKFISLSTFWRWENICSRDKKDQCSDTSVHIQHRCLCAYGMYRGKMWESWGKWEMAGSSEPLAQLSMNQQHYPLSNVLGPSYTRKQSYISARWSPAGFIRDAWKHETIEPSSPDGSNWKTGQLEQKSKRHVVSSFWNAGI